MDYLKFVGYGKNRAGIKGFEKHIIDLKKTWSTSVYCWSKGIIFNEYLLNLFLSLKIYTKKIIKQ